MPGLGTNKKANVIRTNGGTQAKPKGGTVGQQQWLGGGNQWAPKGNGPQPKQGLGAAPQPGAAPPVQPQTTPMPWDVAASNQEAGANKSYGDRLANIESNRVLLGQEYGLGYFDPQTGQYVNPTDNPYSRAALLQTSYNNAKKGTLNSAGNQLYAGSYINRQNTNTRNFNIGSDQLAREFARAQAALVGEEGAALEAKQNAYNEAGWNRINAGLEAPIEPAPLPTGNKGAGPVKVIKKGKNKGAKYGLGGGKKA